MSGWSDLAGGGGGGGGTVTSVALTAPVDVFDVAGSPIVGAGTLALTFDNQDANEVFAGPASGAAATPAFRALVSADMPDSAQPMHVSYVKNGTFALWENGVSAAPDAWTLAGAGSAVARSATVKQGAYSAKVTRSGTNVTFVQDVYAWCGSTYIQSREFTFGAWVNTDVGSQARLRINDGVGVTNSSYHTGGGTWEFLTVTATMDAAAAALTVGLEVNIDGDAYFDFAALVEGDALTIASPGYLPFNEFPQRALMWHSMATITVGNALNIGANTSQMYCALPYQNAAANGDTFTHSFWMRAGSYTLAILGSTSPNRGKLDVYFDNVLVVSGQDWYSGGTVLNVVKTASVTVIADGYHVFKGVVNGKNGSSSDYFMALTCYWLYPTAD